MERTEQSQRVTMVRKAKSNYLTRLLKTRCFFASEKNTSLSSHFSFRRLAPRFQHHDGKLNSSLSAASQDFIPWNNQ